MAKVLKQFHDRLYETYEQKEISLKKGVPSRIRLRALLETLDELNGDTVLDIGCAEGVFTLYLAKKRSFCVGLDFVKISLSRLRAKALKRMIGNIDAVLSDAHYLPIRDKCFDIVLCSEVLEHVLEPSKVLSELRRVTNSWVVISVPCSAFVSQNKSIHKTCESVGFQDVCAAIGDSFS